MWLTTEQRWRAEKLISVFENGTTSIQYGHAENIADGRGVTAGRAGFTTRDGDALEIIRSLGDVYFHNDNALASFIPALEAVKGTSDTSSLPENDYIDAWKETANSEYSGPAFHRAQDDFVDANLYQPAMKYADNLGLTLPLARAELFDAIIQHGDGPDADGLAALIAAATDKAGGDPSIVGEPAWLDTFIDVRRDDLSSKVVWAESVDRVECMRRLGYDGYGDLHGPITFYVFDTANTFTIA